MLGCVGVYFWLVLFYMQANASPYLIYEMQHLESMANDSKEIDTFKWSFLITSGVSLLLFITNLVYPFS